MPDPPWASSKLSTGDMRLRNLMPEKTFRLGRRKSFLGKNFVR